MSRRKKSVTADAGAVRGPRTAPKPWIDARILLVAALIASPAIYRSQQGLLPTSTALDRLLLVTVGCVALSALVRLLWPLVVDVERPETAVVAGVPMPAEAADALDPTLLDDAYAGLGDLPAPGAVSPPGAGLDLLETDVDPTALLSLEPGQG